MPDADGWIFRAEQTLSGRDVAPASSIEVTCPRNPSDSFAKAWEDLLPAGDALVASFYAKLFESNPALEKLFTPTDMKEQRRKFIVMLSEIVRVLDTPDLLISEVADSGKRHVTYGVQDRDYEDVGAALLWAIGEALGPRCTPEVLSAWREAYDLLAAVMRRAATRTSGASFPAVVLPPESRR